MSSVIGITYPNGVALERESMMYSFFATCKANDINPDIRLTDVLVRIGETEMSALETLLPRKDLYKSISES